MQPLPRPPQDAPPSSSNRNNSSNGRTGNRSPLQPTTATDATTNSAANMTSQPLSTSTVPQGDAQQKKRRRHRGGKKKKQNRRQSFIAPSDTGSMAYTSTGEPHDDHLGRAPIDEHVGASLASRRRDFYQRRNNTSGDSLDSEALLDHRDQPIMRPRRDSRLLPSLFSSANMATGRSPGRSGFDLNSPGGSGRRRLKSRSSENYTFTREVDDEDDDDHDQDDMDANDRTPLISGPAQHKRSGEDGYGIYRSQSRASSKSSKSRGTRRRQINLGTSVPNPGLQDYDVNNPPSRPASPTDEDPNDVMVSNSDFLSRSVEARRNQNRDNQDALIDIDDDDDCMGNGNAHSAPPSPRLRPDGLQRHRAMTLPAEGDVCFPGDAMSEMAEEEMQRTPSNRNRPRRRKRREWPTLWVLDQWSQEEKEARDGERRAKKINEPVLVGGRLRPRQHNWHREEEDAPYRYTYFNEYFESTIHAQTISELVQPGGTFRELFIPEGRPLSSSSESSETEEEEPPAESRAMSPKATDEDGVPASRLSSLLTEVVKPASKEDSGKASKASGNATPQRGTRTPQKEKKVGERPTFWLDVLSPTEQEMRVLCRAFGIHALTSEDIMMQEAREKVELFRNYYFINYRTFEQDPNSEDYLEPVNMYVCVFRHGIVTFHFSQIPHPANVRRRIRQLVDYLILSADWISYAIIDDITDVYQPLITSIEEEVDDIDDLILNAFQSTNELAGDADSGVGYPPMPGQGKDRKGPDSNAAMSEKNDDGPAAFPSGIDVLRRIGECRKKTTSLYRLLGQKADVIKGFAKRCNEQWEVAPRSEIGLYLGDIQDHIITMSANLNHYETSLSRAHSNYLAQVNIRMGERQESTADILGKLTVIGTIVLPMNVICGMWGMNVMVPGQEVENLYWFWGITAFMGVFAVGCFYWCKKVYKIV